MFVQVQTSEQTLFNFLIFGKSRFPLKKFYNRGAAIAQWIRLRIQSYQPGFENQAHNLRFFHL